MKIKFINQLKQKKRLIFYEGIKKISNLFSDCSFFIKSTIAL